MAPRALMRNAAAIGCTRAAWLIFACELF